MKQLKIAFDDALRRRLEAAAKASGKSMADEVRVRLEQTFEADKTEKPDKALLAAITNLIGFVQRQTGWSWHQAPIAFEIFRQAITTLLDRVQPREAPAGEPPHVPTMIVASSDTAAIGMGLEALASFAPVAFTPGNIGRVGGMDLAELRQHLTEAEAGKEADKAIRKIHGRGKRGKS